MKYAEGTISPLLVSRKEATRLLNLCQKSVDLLISDGRLKATKIGGRVMLSMSALADFATAGCPTRIREDCAAKAKN